MKPISLVLLLVFLAVLGWLVYANVGLFRDVATARQLAHSGVLAPARVLSAGQSIHGQASTYQVTLTFTPPGASPVTLTRDVDFASYSTISNSHQAQVRYLPADPQGAEVVGNARGGINVVLMLALDLLFLGFTGFLAWAVIGRK